LERSVELGVQLLIFLRGGTSSSSVTNSLKPTFPTTASAAQMAAEIQAAAKEKGIAGALNNGLTDEQNQELFRIVDPATSAELILKGLNNLAEG
jgi:hypothetical protein